MPGRTSWRRACSGVAVEVLHQERPRPYQAHITFQHIEQFRKLIEARGPEKTAEGGQSVRIGKEVAPGVSGIRHRPELEHPEGPPAQAGALLAEQNRSPQQKQYQQSNERQQRQQHDHRGKGSSNIEGPLYCRHPSPAAYSDTVFVTCQYLISRQFAGNENNGLRRFFA